MQEKKKVCVYCGSSLGKDGIYARTAEETGRIIARLGMILLYGGACCGTMGKLADAAMKNGGEVHGIIPDFFKDYDFEVIHPNLSKLIRVKSMSERKQMLIGQADIFVALPGSYGTLDELFETLVLAQLKQIEKPVFLLNLNGFYSPLLAQLDKMQEAEFLLPVNRSLLQTANTVEELENKLRELV